jgi:hypothetical protein
VSGTCVGAGGVGTCAAETAPNPCLVGPDPTCGDCVQNGFETDVDCGGETCLPCGAGRACALDGDCLSTLCTNGACTSGAAGRPCRTGSDCASGACGTGTCITGSCCQ